MDRGGHGGVGTHHDRPRPLLAGDVEAVPGAPDLTRWLKSLDVPVAVVTSAGAPWADRVLSDKLGVRHLVDAVVSAEQVTVGKPSWAVQFSRPGV